MGRIERREVRLLVVQATRSRIGCGGSLVGGLEAGVTSRTATPVGDAECDGAGHPLPSRTQASSCGRSQPPTSKPQPLTATGSPAGLGFHQGVENRNEAS